MNPLVSVITLNWNRKDDLLRTLRSISNQTYQPKETVVVDNGSEDGSAENVNAQYPDARVLRLVRNLGVEGYNIGMKEAAGDILVLIDNDMDLLQTDTFEKVIACFHENQQLGAAAFQVRDQSRAALSPNNPKFWKDRGNDEIGYPCSTFDGGGVAFSKAVLEKVGYYLPQFFIYHSEVELSTRIWDAGYEVRYFPKIAVSHRESAISRNPRAQTFYATRNYLWYVWLYFPRSKSFAETFHFLQRSLIQNVRQRKSVLSWFHGLLAAVLNWRSVRQSHEPAKKETIEWMQLLRDKDRERKLSANFE